MADTVDLVRRYLMRNRHITPDDLREYAMDNGVYLTAKQASDVLRGLARREKLRSCAYSTVTKSGQHALTYYSCGLSVRTRSAEKSLRKKTDKKVVENVFLLQIYWRHSR